MASSSNETITSDINLLSRFLAHPQLQDLSTTPPVDSIVICVSAVFHSAEILFNTLSLRPNLTKSLILCGGIGHSTPLIYSAIAKHKMYHPLAEEIQGLPEARVLYKIMERHFDIPSMTSAGCKILIEDKSTNCAANAVESRKVLEDSGLPTPKSCVIVQDPTMALRTVASFEQTYSDLETPPRFLSFPGFVPEVKWEGEGARFVGDEGLLEWSWEMERFLNLIMGEIPRFGLYGPEGKGSIARVDIPVEVQEAWSRLGDVLVNRR